ncbi:MAG: DUF1449 domain-containing protein [Planctomycetota bacterium]
MLCEPLYQLLATSPVGLLASAMPGVPSTSIESWMDGLVVGPVWPATLMLVLLVMYTSAALLGLVDLDFGSPDIEAPDFDVPDIDVPDMDVPDVDMPTVDAPDLDVAETGSTLDILQGFGAMAIRATNLGRVPMIIWAALFAVLYWCISYGLWHNYDIRRYEPTLWPSVLLSLRNLVLTVICVKAGTQPLIRFFELAPDYDARYLIGSTCEVTTSEATDSFGQAKYRTDAAPLLLNVRTDGSNLQRGDEARIVAFDPKKRIYTITAITPETAP